uniref:Uncharacterized protein n=1 Tax=Lygus hesperus TaxID=30085 RepID=A0A0A9YNJ5_LYGHE
MKYTKQQILAYLGEAYLHLGNVVVAYAHLSVLAKRADIVLLFWFQMLLMNWPEIPLAYRKKLRREMVLKKDVHMALSRTYLFKNDLKRAVKMGRRAATYARATEGIRNRALPYTYALDLDVAGGHFSHANKMELKFIKSALSIYESTSVESTVSMGCLYSAAFKSRYYSGNLVECIQPGEIALKIAQAAQAVEAEVFLLQKLVMALLHTKNFEKMQEILHPKMYMKEELNSYNHVSKMKLYHRLILEAFLEGSIALENPIRIFAVLKKSVDRHHLNIEHPGTRSNGLLIWLWYLRKGEFNRASNWQIPEYPELDIRQESMGDLLRIVQCQLLWLESKMRTNETFSPRMESCSNNLRYLLRIMKKKFTNTPHICYPGTIISKLILRF